MSIALSAQIVPSRLLQLAYCLMAAVLFITSIVLLRTAGVNHFLFSVNALLGAVCAIASFALVAAAFRRQTALRIDVTGLGQIHLVETCINAGAGSPTRSNAPGEVVRLCPGSTLWSSLMVLRLQSVSGRITTLVLLPDSLSDDEFRSLSVACRWIAAKHGRHDALRTDVSPWVS